MDPIQRFGGGGETYVHPVVVCAMLLSMALIWILPRKHIVVPVLATIFLVPMDQVIILGPCHFSMLRIVLLGGWIRLLKCKVTSRSPFLSGGVTPVDKMMLWYAVVTAIDFVLLWRDWGAVVNQLGNVYTTLGCYVLLRSLIRDEEDTYRVIQALAYIAVVMASVMVIEQGSGRNPYAVFGGTAATLRASLMARGERYRAMAAFGHPILAGTFGAISVPLFVALWFTRKQNTTAVVGACAGVVITVASVSSTPLLTLAAGIVALCLWPLRRSMRFVRWGILLTLCGLHIAMKAPVWALIGRMDIIGGSSGWHRYYLVDQCIKHFWDWWLVGTTDNAQWGWDMFDVANQYVAIGEGAGLVPLALFLSIIVYGFKQLGKARHSIGGTRDKEHFAWAMTAALFANVVAFVGISYFDQTIVAWYMLLAIIPASLTARTRRRKPIAPFSSSADYLGEYDARMSEADGASAASQ